MQFKYANVVYLRYMIIYIWCGTALFNLFLPTSVWKGSVLFSSSLATGCYYLSFIVWNGKFKKNRLELLFSIPVIGILGPAYCLKNASMTTTPFWTLGLVVGLHFGFLGLLPIFKNFDITPSEMKLWKWQQWTLFYTILYILAIVGVYVLSSVPYTVLVPILTLYATMTFCIAAITWFIYPVYVFHFHHYFIAAYSMPMFSFCSSDAMTIFVLAILSGIYTQGVVRGGIAWIWQKNQNQPVT